MISCNQKSVVLIWGLALALQSMAVASQVRQRQISFIEGQDKQDHGAHDDPVENDASDQSDDGEEDEAAVSKAKASSEPVYVVKRQMPEKNAGAMPEKKAGAPKGLAKKDEEQEEAEGEAEDQQKMLNSHLSKDKKETRLELAANLRKQSELKHSIEHFTDQVESDEEIDADASLVANETGSEEMAQMLANMWKDMRMFEVPLYEEHVQEELERLKKDERALELKLEGKKATKADDQEQEEPEKDDEEKGAKNAEVEADSEAPPVTYNVWTMSWAQKRTVSLGSLVYVLGGLLVAFLFNQVRAKHFPGEMQEDVRAPLTTDFSFQIFGCLADWKLCLLGFCCPCLAWANTLDRSGLLPYWKAFLAFFFLTVLHTWTMGLSSLVVVALGVFYRQKLREAYDLDSGKSKGATVALDFLLWCCCQPCAIVQEAREETARRKEDQLRIEEKVEAVTSEPPRPDRSEV